MKGVEFIYVSTDETRQKQEEMKLVKTKPLKGTLKLHAIGVDVESGRKTVMTRKIIVLLRDMSKWIIL